MGHVPTEVAKTVLEVADVAWTALESCHHHYRDHDAAANPNPSDEKELESLRSENRRLRDLLQQNLNLLQNLSESPCLLQDCPSDVRKLVSYIYEIIFLCIYRCFMFIIFEIRVLLIWFYLFVMLILPRVGNFIASHRQELNFCLNFWILRKVIKP